MNKAKLRLSCGVMLLILAGVLYSLHPWLEMVRERGRRTSCLSNLKQIGLAFTLYEADHDTNGMSLYRGWPSLPEPVRSVRMTDLTRYIGGDGNVCLFLCPSAIRKMAGDSPRTISGLTRHPEWAGYDFLSVSRATSTVSQTWSGWMNRDRSIGPTVIPVLCDKPGNHGADGITILFADGHAAWWAGTIEAYARSNNLVITVVTNWVR